MNRTTMREMCDEGPHGADEALEAIALAFLKAGKTDDYEALVEAAGL